MKVLLKSEVVRRKQIEHTKPVVTPSVRKVFTSESAKNIE